MPKHGNDMDACTKTEDYIKDVTQQSNIFSYTSMKGGLVIWSLNASDSQADRIRKEEVVADISLDDMVIAKHAAVVSPLLPFDPAKLSQARKAKRLLHCDTPVNAEYDYRMIN